jgi:hypothetical protein
LQEEKIAPKPYVYEYGGVDPSGLASAKSESQDADGVVHGKTNVLFSIIFLKFNLCTREKERDDSIPTLLHSNFRFGIGCTPVYLTPQKL